MATILERYKSACDQAEHRVIRNEKMRKDAACLRNIFFTVNTDKLEALKSKWLLHNTINQSLVTPYPISSNGTAPTNGPPGWPPHAGSSESSPRQVYDPRGSNTVPHQIVQTNTMIATGSSIPIALHVNTPQRHDDDSATESLLSTDHLLSPVSENKSNSKTEDNIDDTSPSNSIGSGRIIPSNEQDQANVAGATGVLPASTELGNLTSKQALSSMLEDSVDQKQLQLTNNDSTDNEEDGHSMDNAGNGLGAQQAGKDCTKPSSGVAASMLLSTAANDTTSNGDRLNQVVNPADDRSGTSDDEDSKGFWGSPHSVRGHSPREQSPPPPPPLMNHQNQQLRTRAEQGFNDIATGSNMLPKDHDSDSVSTTSSISILKDQNYPRVISSLLTAINTNIRKERELAHKVYAETSVTDDMISKIQDSPVLTSVLIKRAEHRQDLSSWDTATLSSVLLKLVAKLVTTGHTSVNDLTSGDSALSEVWPLILEHIRILFQCGRGLESIAKVFALAIRTEEKKLLELLHTECGIDDPPLSPHDDFSVSSLTSSASITHDDRGGIAGISSYQQFAQVMQSTSHNTDALSSTSEDSAVAAFQSGLTSSKPATNTNEAAIMNSTKEEESNSDFDNSVPIPLSDESDSPKSKNKPITVGTNILQKQTDSFDDSESKLSVPNSTTADDDDFAFYS